MPRSQRELAGLRRQVAALQVEVADRDAALAQRDGAIAALEHRLTHVALDEVCRVGQLGSVSSSHLMFLRWLLPWCCCGAHRSTLVCETSAQT